VGDLRRGHPVVVEEGEGKQVTALASLHSWEHSFQAFPAMQAGYPFLHNTSLHQSLCRLPNTGGLHCVSLDRAYAACQSHPTYPGVLGTMGAIVTPEEHCRAGGGGPPGPL
jgi:hypothetical protein